MVQAVIGLVAALCPVLAAWLKRRHDRDRQPVPAPPDVERTEQRKQAWPGERSRPTPPPGPSRPPTARAPWWAAHPVRASNDWGGEAGDRVTDAVPPTASPTDDRWWLRPQRSDKADAGVA
jgi:hypothetical protein